MDDEKNGRRAGNEHLPPLEGIAYKTCIYQLFKNEIEEEIYKNYTQERKWGIKNVERKSVCLSF